MNDTPLDRSKMVVVDGHILLTTPTKATMVDDEILGILDTQACTSYKATVSGFGKVCLIDFTHTETQVTDDDIILTLPPRIRMPSPGAV